MISEEPSEQSKIIEKLFTYPDNKDIQTNRQRNLIVNPEMLRVLIHQHELCSISQKMKIWGQISSIYGSNQLNASILSKRDKQILEFNHSIYDEIITFIFSIRCKLPENQQIIKTFQPLIQGYPITCRNIKNIISKVSLNFHQEKFDCQKLQLCINLLTVLFKDQVWPETSPQSYFVMYGPNSGLRLTSRELKWSLNKGFHFYIGFKIQKGEHDQSYLLSILVNEESFQLIIDEGNYLRVKVFGTSKIYSIKQLEENNWYFLKLSYTLKTGIIRNSFHFVVHLQGDPYELTDLPVPSISMKDNIEELVVGHNFYGKINIVAISKQELHSWPKAGFNTQSQLQNFLTTNKNKLKQIFLLYTPLICTQLNSNLIIYDIINQNHTEILENTTIFHHPFESVDINYYGGLYTMIPFFYILRFYRYEQYPTALEETLEMVFNLFVLKYKNIEEQAINCHFFSLLGQFFNYLDQRYFTVKVIEMIRVWRELIKNKVLLRNFFINFLTKFSIDRLTDRQVAQKWLNLIGNMYYRDFSWAIELFPLSDVVWYIVDNFQPEKVDGCCLLHYSEQNSTEIENISSDIMDIKDQYKRKGQQIKQILIYIIREIFKRGKYELFTQNYDIIQFLLHKYSICFNSLLMDCLLVGVIEQPWYFIKETQFLQTLYSLLPKAQTKDQLIPILRIMKQFLKISAIKNTVLHEEIITHIGEHLDKIYMKKYAKIKLRSKSEVLTQTLVRKSSQRKFSVAVEQQPISKNANFLNLMDQSNIDDKLFKNRIIELRKLRRNKIDNDKALYTTILDLCCIQDQQTGDLVLKDDLYVKIIAPYFKICSLKLKTNLIEIVKMTVFLKSAQQNMPPHMQSMVKLDLIYRFILSEFVLKELDPEDPEYRPSQNSNYIMKNLYYIIDNMVHAMKNNWDNLYLYLIRLIQLLKEARKDIQIKTSRNKQEILRATKVSSRKFIIRILNWAQENLNNMSNMVFFVYLVVFNNEKNQLYTIFDYFRTLEHNFFIDTIQIINEFQHRTLQKPIFIDQRIILSVIEAFHLDNFHKNSQRKNMLNQIRAYLELQEENETQKKLNKLRGVFLSWTQFKELGLGSKGFRGMLINFAISEEQRQRNVLRMHVAEIMAVLLCLCIESSVFEQRYQILEQSLKNLENFVKVFVLSMSRDNLKRENHSQRNKKLPRNLVFHIIHFLYVILDRDLPQNFYKIVEKTIFGIINYLTLVMTVLCEKIGNPQSSEDVQLLSAVMQDVEQFNFFAFSILNSSVITIGQIKVFSTLEEKKALEVIHHPHLRQHFKEISKTFIEKHVKEVVEIHKLNLEKIEKEITEKFTKRVETGRIIIDSGKFYDKEKFDKYQLEHARNLNVEYRQMMRIWRKIWKRLRLYHYYWSIGMDQKEKFEEGWKKNHVNNFKHKFSKYMDLQGLRPILQVQPNEPWHIRKARLDQQVNYRSKNFMQNLHKEKLKKESQPKSFIDKIFRKSYSGSEFSVFWIKHNSKRKGVLTINNGQKLIFEYDSTFQKDSHVDFVPFLLAEHKPMKKSWSLVCITNIIKRRYLTRNQCLLIEFQDNTALIFHFLDHNTEQFLMRIEQLQTEKQDKHNLMKLNKIKFYLKNFRTRNIYQEIEQISNEWCQGKYTNLHYLLLLNKYSGRSFLDPVNYPVMPWVISNYQCKQIMMRDLSLTLGALGSETRKQFYENKYESSDPFSNVPPYQFGTHYSSPGVVFNFLIRISPYTEAAKSLQGGRFDLSDRLFNSVKVCWNSVTTEISDVRELLPEFYYMPEFLINIENYDFGITQQKERVHNVKLPIWGQNPWDFITNHRRVLQSDEVTVNIHNWIDLIFGYKQKGKIAKENINLYYYLTYQNSINLDEIQNDIERTSIEAQIIHFGQTPTQLFYKPHPQNQKITKITEKKTADLHKIKFLGIIQSISSVILLGWQGNENGRLLIFRDSYLMGLAEGQRVQLKSEVNLKRTASKENIYHVEDLQFIHKVQLFCNNKFIAIGSYVNGDLVVYTISGEKVEHHKGFPKSYVYVNKAQNLILCGSKNGLLQVYQIIYFQKDTIKLVKIISEYFMYPIIHISEGAGFYSFSCGNLVIVSKIFRSLSYVHQKIKMQGQKLIRSFQSRRKVYGSFICTNPLYCVVFYNLLEVIVYSINGQFLKLKQIQSLVDPILILDDKKRQNLLCLQPTGLSLLSLPYLDIIVHVAVPKKQYTHIRLLNNRVYLATSSGEIYYVFNQKQMIWI